MAAAKRGKRTAAKRRTRRHAMRAGDASPDLAAYLVQKPLPPDPEYHSRPPSYVYGSEYETEEQRAAREYTMGVAKRNVAKREKALERALVRDGYDEEKASFMAGDISLLDGRHRGVVELVDEYVRWSAQDGRARAATRRPPIEDAMRVFDHFYPPDHQTFTTPFGSYDY
eukprot:jgi/Mesvir1/22143/Mv18745-RA.1